MITMTAGDIAALVGGELVGLAASVSVTGPVVVDSREATTGALFVCIEGEHNDGHLYVTDALQRGAVVALARRPIDGPAIIVDDTVRALGFLAGGLLRRMRHCRVVGVTGSTGKTSTKDLIAAVLSGADATVAPKASLNNEIGLPLTVLGIDETTQHLVLEYSARGIGHIDYLCGIARPVTAAVLNVGTAHLGEFGSREVVALAKGELIEALPAGGVAVLGVDDPLVSAMRSRTSARVLGFGSSAHADVRIEDLVLDAHARPRFTLVTPSGTAKIVLLLSGAHHAFNAAAAMAVGLAEGLELDQIAASLADIGELSAHRMRVTPRDDGLLVVDDAYNANPESVRAALDALSVLTDARSGVSWAVLGEMRELGEESTVLHEAMGRHAADIGIDHLVVVGKAAHPIAVGARSVAGWLGTVDVVANADVATSLVEAAVSRDDVVLVKASNAIRLWQVAEALLAPGSGGSAPVGMAT